MIERAAGELRLSRSLIYRLIARYRQQPQLTSLVPRKRGRVALPTLEDECEALIQSVIREVYLTAWHVFMRLDIARPTTP
jgi:putative transposase